MMGTTETNTRSRVETKMAHLSVNTPVTAGLGARLGHVMADIKGRYARYRLYRNTLVEMQSLSDRELADLGLSRSMIRRVAYKAAYS